MKTEKACGAIIHRQNQEGITEILLVKQLNGLTAFPKGHTEPGETELETAKREVLEETGLQISIPHPEHRLEFSYTIKPGAKQSSHPSVATPIHKIVVLFLATLAPATSGAPDASTSPNNTSAGTPQPGEISELLWLPIDEVASHLTYPEWHSVWTKALPLLPSK